MSDHLLGLWFAQSSQPLRSCSACLTCGSMIFDAPCGRCARKTCLRVTVQKASRATARSLDVGFKVQLEAVLPAASCRKRFNAQALVSGLSQVLVLSHSGMCTSFVLVLGRATVEQ